MTPEEKELLLKDLCARLPYGVVIIPDGQTTPYRVIDIDFNKELVVVKPKDRGLMGIGWLGFEDFKLILRPMSSMTEEEVKEFAALESIDVIGGDIKITCVELSIDAIDWLNKKMFDYRGLIKKGLAIEALEGMYNF